MRFNSRPALIKRANVWSCAVEYTMFFRKRSVEGVWFDESVGAGTSWRSGEAADLLLQLLQRKAVLFYDPRLVVIHPSPVLPYDDESARKAFSDGCGLGRVLKKHGYPIRSKIWWLIKPLVRATSSLLLMRISRDRLHYSKFRGRLKELLS
jgi:hypothetical protein